MFRSLLTGHQIATRYLLATCTHPEAPARALGLARRARVRSLSVGWCGRLGAQVGTSVDAAQRALEAELARGCGARALATVDLTPGEAGARAIVAPSGLAASIGTRLKGTILPRPPRLTRTRVGAGTARGHARAVRAATMRATSAPFAAVTRPWRRARALSRRGVALAVARALGAPSATAAHATVGARRGWACPQLTPHPAPSRVARAEGLRRRRPMHPRWRAERTRAMARAVAKARRQGAVRSKPARVARAHAVDAARSVAAAVVLASASGAVVATIAIFAHALPADALAAARAHQAAHLHREAEGSSVH